MKILILEDRQDKYQKIKEKIEGVVDEVAIYWADNFQGFHKQVEREKFDLVIVDLLAPTHAGAVESNLTAQIIDAIRDHACLNFRTPVLALTQYMDAAEEGYKDLNLKDITIATFDSSSEGWVGPLQEKIRACLPPIHYDFLIVCALPKEAAAFEEVGYKLDRPVGLLGLEVRAIEIAGRRGAVVVPPRMGLVSCAIATAKAIEFFKPNLVCMSGICAGIGGRAGIYDVVIPDICHQHDSGKWGEHGFEPELYSVQLIPDVRLKLIEIISSDGFLEMFSDIKVAKSELPDNMEYFSTRVFLAPASSGSSVVADEDFLATVTAQHRKSTAFEMESYALYEAARLSLLRLTCPRKIRTGQN